MFCGCLVAMSTQNILLVHEELLTISNICVEVYILESKIGKLVDLNVVKIRKDHLFYKAKDVVIDTNGGCNLKLVLFLLK